MPEERDDTLDIAIDQTLLPQSYTEFFKAAWHTIEDTSLAYNWHIAYLCLRLQYEIERIGRNEPRRKHLCISIPPRSSKSSIVTKFWNAWAWIDYPWIEFLTSSFSGTLSEDHSVDTRTIIESDWYRARFGDSFAPGDKWTNTKFQNDKGGHRIATSVTGATTGLGGLVVIGDDLLDPQVAHSEAERKASLRHAVKVLPGRLNDKRIGICIYVQQRAHESDPIGHLLKEDSENWDFITIPAEDKYPISPPSLKRFYVDGLFDPERFSHKILRGEFKRLQALDYAAQYGQQPKAPGGNMIKGEWFPGYDLRDLLDQVRNNGDTLDFHYLGDTAFTKKQTNSATAFLCATVYNKRLYLVDVLRVWETITALTGILSPDEVKVKKEGLIQAFIKRNGYTSASGVWIEPKASGKDIIDVLRLVTGFNIIEYTGKTEDKVTSVNSILYILAAQRVYRPFTSTWWEAFRDEIEAFSKEGTHDFDDQVDVLVMAVKLLLEPVLLGSGFGTYGNSPEDFEDGDP